MIKEQLIEEKEETNELEMCIRDRTLKAPASLDVDENNQIKGIYVTPQMISSIKDGRASIKPTGEEDI